MGNCINHPNKKTSYKCMKHDYYVCEKCLKCHDPDIYCKFRESCIIYFISKKQFNS